MMKKFILILVIGVLVTVYFGADSFASEIDWQDISGGNSNLQAVLVNPDNPRIIYIGSGRGVLKSEDGGASWRNILSVSGQKRRVNFLLFEPQNKDSLYAATGNGLFYSANQGRNWKRIFQGKDYLENECTALAIAPTTIYLGTKAGLFLSKDKGRSWHREAANLGKSRISAITCDIKEANYVYLACQDGVFKTKDGGQSWERTFVAYSAEKEGNIEEETEKKEEEASVFQIRYLAIDPNNSNYLYLATSKGVYKSQDRGQRWELISSYGLLNQNTRFVLVSNNCCLYAATKSGVFEYRNNRWQELSVHLLAEEVNFLALDNQDNLYAACNKGLFKAKIECSENKKQDSLLSLYYKGEPNISELQQAAIKYAEVEPEKILRWRKYAAKKALLPQVSVGIDRNTTDLWHWESGSTTKSEDDTLRRGRDSIDWNVTLSWNLGELIWNDDQTSIDVRSKLMVELRGNILDEVTKLYFERLRVKAELDNLSIEERKKRFEKEIRLQELAASLDALTGGYFSHP
jgi:photosystem II stability/assembly factor-like uncharacterized protein